MSSPGRRSYERLARPHVHPDNVKVLIGEIRRALGDDPARPQFIRSLVKRGYIFIAPVVDAPADLSAGSSSPVFVGRETEIRACSAPSTRRRVRNGRSSSSRATPASARPRCARHFFASPRRVSRCARRGRSACGSRAPPNRTTPLDLVTRLARSADDETVAATLARLAPSWLPHFPAFPTILGLHRGHAHGHRCQDAARDGDGDRGPVRAHDARPVDRGHSMGGSGDDRRPQQPRPTPRPGAAAAAGDHAVIGAGRRLGAAAAGTRRPAGSAARVRAPVATAVGRRGCGLSRICSWDAACRGRSARPCIN